MNSLTSELLSHYVIKIYFIFIYYGYTELARNVCLFVCHRNCSVTLLKSTHLLRQALPAWSGNTAPCRRYSSGSAWRSCRTCARSRWRCWWSCRRSACTGRWRRPGPRSPGSCRSLRRLTWGPRAAPRSRRTGPLVLFLLS